MILTLPQSLLFPAVDRFRDELAWFQAASALGAFTQYKQLQEAEALRAAANDMYRKGLCDSARHAYTQAIFNTQGVEDVTALLCNMAQCSLLFSSFHTSIAAAGACLCLGGLLKQLMCSSVSAARAWLCSLVAVQERAPIPEKVGTKLL